MDLNPFPTDGNTNPDSIKAVPKPVVFPHTACMYTTWSIWLYQAWTNLGLMY